MVLKITKQLVTNLTWSQVVVENLICVYACLEMMDV